MKLSDIGVGNALAKAALHRNELAAELQHGDWVVYDSNDPEQPIWIGRVMSKLEWENMCVWKNNRNGQQTIDGGVQLHRGEYAINVQWYTQKEIGSLEYHIDRENPRPIVQSNRYLILAGFKMHQIIGSSNRVPRQRTTR